MGSIQRLILICSLLLCSWSHATLSAHEELKELYLMSKKAAEYGALTLDPNATEKEFNYHIKSFRLSYETKNPKGETVTASALVLVRSDIFNKKKEAPSLIHYSHGARFESETAPSTLPADPEAYGARVLLAREGHLVLIPDYLGLGLNNTDLQAYLNADQQARTSWDAMLALKEWCEEIALPLPRKLFLSGYSQGGFVSLTLQRKMQLEKLKLGHTKLIASFPMAGPYNFEGFQEKDLLEDAPPLLYGFIGFMIISLAQDPRYSDIDLYETINEEYHPLLRKVLKKEISLLDFTKEAAKLRYDLYSEDFTDDVTDPEHPIFKAVAAQNITKDWTPEVPTIFMHAKDDEIIPYNITVETYEAFNKAGAREIRFMELPSGLGHVDALQPGMLLLRNEIQKILDRLEKITQTDFVATF